MSAEQKDLEQNALAHRLNSTWARFKRGELLSYKVMAVLLLLVTGIGTWVYISSERKAEASRRWVDEEEASTKEAQEEISAKYPGTIQDKLARLQIARYQLGPAGVELLGAGGAEQQRKAVENIEKARESLQKLLDEFQNDPVFKVQCLYGLAKAEAALVAVPAGQEQAIGAGPLAPATEYKGQVSKVIELLDRVAAEAPADTPWATDSKKLADTLRSDPAEFTNVQRSLFRVPTPTLPKGPDLPGPIGPLAPGPFTPGVSPPTLPGVPGGK